MYFIFAVNRVIFTPCMVLFGSYSRKGTEGIKKAGEKIKKEKSPEQNSVEKNHQGKTEKQDKTF